MLENESTTSWRTAPTFRKGINIIVTKQRVTHAMAYVYIYEFKALGMYSPRKIVQSTLHILQKKKTPPSLC